MDTAEISVQSQQSGPSEDEVRVELERILSNTDIQASEKRSAFLRFIVEETLAGRARNLKGYSIAVAVFGRDETFDAQADPIVRLEARRLRRDLDSYYVAAGSHDPVRISIPKGSYVPHFEWREVAPPTAVSVEKPIVATDRSLPPWKLLLTGLILAAFVLIAVGWFLLDGKKSPLSSITSDAKYGPAIVVLPLEAFNSTENSRFLAEGISQELIGALMRFPGFRLYTLPIGFESAAGPEPATLGRNLGVTYVVSGSVRIESETLHVAMQMLEAGTGRVLWTESYARPLIPEALIGLQRELAGEIATVLGQPYGIVNQDLDVRRAAPAVSTMQSYICVLRAYSYRRRFAREAFGPVLSCLTETVQRDPGYSDAWAMLGWLYLDTGRFEFAGNGSLQALQAHYEKALQAATRAVTIDSTNILALKALASIHHYMGHYDDSERLARQALERNPHDPDTLAQLGWRLAARGKFDEGIPLLRHAIERTVNPPGWYYHFIAVDLYLKGDHEQMLRIAEQSSIDGSGFSQALIAIAAGALGMHDKAQEALAAMSRSELLARDPVAYLRRHGVSDEIADVLITGLRMAREITLR